LFRVVTALQGSDVFPETAHIQAEADDCKGCLVSIAETASGGDHLPELQENYGISGDYRHHDQQKAYGQTSADAQCAFTEQAPGCMRIALRFLWCVGRSRWQFCGLLLKLSS
jgi:hypothetical protein